MKRIAIILFVMACCYQAVSALAQTRPLPETGKSTGGHASVADTLAALRKNPDIRFAVQQGWTLAFDDAHKTIWSFPPRTDPSYPSVVKRSIIEHAGKLRVSMSIDCEASKSACDQLVLRFRKLYEQMRQDIQQASHQFPGSTH